MRDTGKIAAAEQLLVPTSPKGFSYDPKKTGDRVAVFFSLRAIPGLEDLKEKAKITEGDIEDVMRRVNQSDIKSDDAKGIRVIRVSDPNDVLGFYLSISG